MKTIKHSLLGLFVIAALGVFASSTALAADNYKVDAAHSSVVFKINHLGYSNVYGMFPGISGTYSLDSATPANSSVSISIDAGSVSSGNTNRDEHLKSPDFFNVKQFPTITFKSTKVEKGSSANKYKVTGDLTMLGVKKSITIEVNFNGSGQGMKGETRSGFDATFKIKRSDFGMNFGVPNTGDEVTLLTSFEGIKQ
jgi:polyisoprenoid-binding protein YceI